MPQQPPPGALPVDFAFRQVASTGKPRQLEMNQLEVMHKLIPPKPRGRYAVHMGQELSVASATHAPLLLLGIMSGHEARRALLHCSWARVSRSVTSIRVRFVVGSHQPLAAEWEHSPESMELRVNVSEGMRLWRRPDVLKGKHQAFTGTFSTYQKQVAFLRFAATQPEPLVGRADDDAFISPHMVLAYATLLNRLPHAVYAGVFEWISWRAARLEATGFSYGLAEARGRAKASHRNCSRSVPDADSDAYDHVCIGPFGCALARSHLYSPHTHLELTRHSPTSVNTHAHAARRCQRASPAAQPKGAALAH